MINYNDISIPEAAKIQEELKGQLSNGPHNGPVYTIGGADISFNKYSTTVYAGIVVLRYPELTPVAYTLAVAEVKFPYVPGYLAFREVPALLKAWELLPQKPDILVVDGHGIAHPRRMGIAAHFGALTNTTTIGAAKKLLCGKYEEPGNEPRNFSPIHDKNEHIGYVLRTKKDVKPVYISPGHNMDLEKSREIICRCIGKYRIPEPTRQAHEMVNAFRTGKLEAGYHIAPQLLF